jgi:chitinase
LFIEDLTRDEGDATDGLTVPVRLSRPMPGPVSFDIATTAGTADGGDFQAKFLQGVVIPAGQTTYDFEVQILGDAVAEHDQAFTVAVSNVSGIAVADGAALVTLRNDDPFTLPSNKALKLGYYDSYWGFDVLKGGRWQLFVFDTPYPTPKVTFQTNGLSGYDVDLLVKKGSPPTFEDADCISAHAGSTEECVVDSPSGRYYVYVYAFEDAWDVSVRAFHDTLGPPPIILTPASGMEGTAQGQWMKFTARLGWPTDQTVLFYVQTSPGTAIPGEDYEPIGKRSYQLQPGETEVEIGVATYADARIEGNETFQLDLVEAYQATIGTPQARGRIMNDDLAELRIADASVQEGDSGEATMRFTVELSQAMPSPVWFDIGTVAGNASAGSDYVSRPPARRFLDAGRTRQVFEVQVIGDASAEGDEGFGVQLSNVDGALLADGTAQGTIDDDDAPAVRILAGASRVAPIRREPVETCVAPASAAPAAPAPPASRSSARPAPPARSTHCPAAPASPRPARSRRGGRS